ncbi:MAG: hypothetical protein JWQ63_2361 [Mucilaginibacter sp.]|nr:hypothetical protein [Mucilaginibacter sp.]
MISIFKICHTAVKPLLTGISFIIFCHLSVNAQFNISGRVLNGVDKKAVLNASVFLSNATIGTKTDADGDFTLQNVKPGKYDLVVSIIGFYTYHQTIVVNNSSLNLMDIEISVKTEILKEVRIKSGVDSHWQRNYEWFKDGFLGTSSLAKECKILNPAVLDFDYGEKADSLTVSSGDFLVIENKALGYKVKYLVDSFVRANNGQNIDYVGSILFEPMKGTPAQEQRWLKRREKVYEGSVMHFLRSALNNRIEDEGFRVFQYAIYANPDRPTDSLIEAKMNRYKELKSKNTRYRDSLSFWVRKSELPKILHSLMNFPLNEKDIIRLTDQKGVYALRCENDGLYITYNKTHRFSKNGDLTLLNSPYNNESTLLTFNSPYVLFDDKGWILNPNNISFTGAWVKNRVAGLLPVDYEVSNDINVVNDN